MRGKAHIAALSDESLTALFTNFFAPDGQYNYDLLAFKEQSKILGWGNLTMLMLSLGEEAYMRDILDEDDWLILQDEG